MTAPAAKPEVPPRPGRVLVVYDEDAVRAVVSRALEEEGYEVSQARVDAVLTDVVMPRLGGRELVERLAVEYPHLPVIWMSGHPRDMAFGDGGPAKTHPFLQKPIAHDLLARTVAGVLGRQARAT
jgi:CheY-like chemotaxis protein